jgi:hypothetical protein
VGGLLRDNSRIGVKQRNETHQSNIDLEARQAFDLPDDL